MIYPNVLLIPILTVYDKNVDRNEIIMDLDLVFASDAEIKFSLKGISAKISDFSLKGKEQQNSLCVNCQWNVIPHLLLDFFTDSLLVLYDMLL